MQKIIEKSLSKKTEKSTKEVEQILLKKLNQETQKIDFSKVWDAQTFHLNHHKDFLNAPLELQNKILAELAQNRFREAYDIEKAGMSFAAKMSLLSETINEQKLYSLFAAEEATHFHYMQKTLEDVDLTTDDPFIRFLNEVIATGSRRPLIFIIQVILEGWGIDHYQLMERSCLNPELKKHLKLILIDEASHHGSGVSLFNESELTKAEFDYTIEMMSEFLNMINIGPVGLVGAVKKYLPHSKEADLLNDISAVDDTNRKLTYIKNMMVKSQSHKILEKIENSGLFQLRF